MHLTPIDAVRLGRRYQDVFGAMQLYNDWRSPLHSTFETGEEAYTAESWTRPCGLVPRCEAQLEPSWR